VINDLQISGTGQYYFDFRVNGKAEFQKEEPVLVLELSDTETGEQIFWHGFNIKEKQGFLHFSFDVRHDREMTLKSYFWNNKEAEGGFSNTSCHLYRLHPMRR